MFFAEHRVSPIKVNVTPKSLRITEGSSALFLCSVNTNLITHTRSWSRDGYRLLPDTAKVHDGTLAFHNARREDTGVYTCSASNQVTVDSATVVLSVGGMFSIFTKFQLFLCGPAENLHKTLTLIVIRCYSFDFKSSTISATDCCFVTYCRPSKTDLSSHPCNIYSISLEFVWALMFVEALDTFSDTHFHKS